MCGLCGIFAGADHWSDSPADNGETRARSRQVRTKLANQVLAHYSLKINDTGGSLLLRSATGQAALVPHLGALWSAADRLARKPCDPLDPELIAALKRAEP
ncbi:MAG: hypothetical protein ACREDW_01410 [Aestuariivirgaceae bacterium]